MSQRYQRQLIIIVLILAAAIYIVIPNSPGIHLAGINKDFQTRLGLDLVGGIQALLEADLPPDAAITTDSMRTAVNIVENRVNALGVNEPVVQQAGDRRIVVELPGETDPEKALAALQQTGLMEFVDFSNLAYEEVSVLQGSETKINTDFGLTLEEAAQLEATLAASQPQDTTTSVIPAAYRVYHTIMTGADLKNVRVETNQQTNELVIAFELTTEGTEIFKNYTTNHVNDILAIVLDGKIISAPSINEPITDGAGVISGNFTYETANTLAVQLRYGSLPIPLKVVEVRTIGPTLGQDSLQKSLLAGGIGFAIIILFMALYYRLPGLVADLAIVFYALLAFAIFRYIPVTLTLAGVAGFLLSTGSALDANILIFERIKEELRSGKTLRQAIDLGWRRAWPSIRDSNIATLITSAILFWFGSTYGATFVKGFSITLALGVAVSLFTALVVSRTIMEIVISNFKSTNYAKWFGI
jgi:preprotein translocase subunit SecD